MHMIKASEELTQIEDFSNIIMSSKALYAAELFSKLPPERQAEVLDIVKGLLAGA